MTRKTSIEAYNKIKADGLLSALQFSIYSKLYDGGPMTQGELWHKYFQYFQRHSVAPRFAELKERGVIEGVGERPCRLTGVNAIVWDVTDQLPHDPAPKTNTTKALIESLMEKIKVLEKRVREFDERQYEPNGQGTFAMRNH